MSDPDRGWSKRYEIYRAADGIWHLCERGHGDTPCGSFGDTLRRLVDWYTHDDSYRELEKGE